MDLLERIQSRSRPAASEVAFGFVLLYLVYSVTNIIYNVYFHPLAKFPGPPLRCGIWAIDAWHTYAGNPVWEEKALHEKYGPVVRVNPDSLSFSTAQAWRDIAGTRAGKPQLQKDPEFYIPRGGMVDLVTASGKDHSRMRKLLSHAFSDTALREQESLIAQYVDLFIYKLMQQIDGPNKGRVDFVSWFNFITFDIIGDLALGDSFGSLEKGEYHFWVTNVFRGLKFTRFILPAHRYRLLWVVKLLYVLIPGFGRGQKESLKFESERAKKRLASSTDRKDFMSYILRYNDERGMTPQEIQGNSGMLIVAGSETTASLLSGATYHLLKNPQTLEKLTAEVRGRFKLVEELNVSAISQLPYLNAVLEESLRIYPTVPLRMPRRTGSQVEIIDGYHVPPNTSVGVHHYATYHAESNFHNPEAFVPERWLPDAPKEYANDVKASMQAFSVGARNCLGRNLAYVEMRSILARLVWNFDMELDPASDGWADERRQKAFVIWEKPPLWVKLSKRKDVH